MEKYVLEMNPKAKEENIIQGENYRITVLTPRLIRLEYQEENTFIDHSTQVVFNRDFAACDFEVKDTEEELQIITEALHLIYNKREFSPNGLSIQVRGNVSVYFSLWHYGETGYNLGGTARTLDAVDGSCELEDGILSQNGFAVLDDSGSLLLTDDGWVTPRNSKGQDLYFFGYGRDYKGALKDYYYLCGKTPMLPRYALGNWWSRYYRYSEESYKDLILRFEREQIPFSVAVIDMDWHLVDIDQKYGSGWTGFTWNRELFPNPEKFMEWLHEHNLKVTLNVHPADGIRAHEEMYLQMANALGRDVAKEAPLQMDVTDRTYMEAYFKYAHHPNERDGVDFWWIDWQQGTASKIEGLDPLWMLNHFYFLDSGRDGKRPMTFSRYAGPGSHRYPIGFSGDSIISWESLRFQPYFTATASNIGYGWWSHDIGGHMCGYKDDELAVRWLQFGVFSPIMRLHSSNSEFNGKEPWRYSPEACEVMKQFLRLRHAMIPYLYSMNYRNYEKDVPLIEPMYYEHTEEADAYRVPNQYYFGSECIVAPITSPRDLHIGLACQQVWLPEGNYMDVFTGLFYQGGRILNCYRSLDALPVFLKEGAIVPFMNEMEAVEVNPDTVRIMVFPGKSNVFEFYEDDNVSIAYEKKHYVKTLFELKELAVNGAETQNAKLKIYPASGELSLIPEYRNYELEFWGNRFEDAKIYLDGYLLAEDKYRVEDLQDARGKRIRVKLSDIAVTSEIQIQFCHETLHMNQNVTERCFSILNKAQIAFEEKDRVYQIIKADMPVAVKLNTLLGVQTNPVLIGALSEVLTGMSC